MDLDLFERETTSTETARRPSMDVERMIGSTTAVEYGNYGYVIGNTDVLQVAVVLKCVAVAAIHSDRIQKRVGVYFRQNDTNLGVFIVDQDGSYFDEETAADFTRAVNGAEMGLERLREISSSVLIGYTEHRRVKEIYYAVEEMIRQIGSVGFRCKSLVGVGLPELFYDVANSGENETYVEFIKRSFLRLRELTDTSLHVAVDTAGGAMVECIEELNENQEMRVTHLMPTVKNKKQGAEYVYNFKKIPRVQSSGCLTGSFDAMGTRLVFYKENSTNLRIYDGDVLGSYVINYIDNLLRAISKEVDLSISRGIVLNELTSTVCMDYLTNRGIEFTLTGLEVKHMQEKTKIYDISVLSNPEGYLTASCSSKAVALLERAREAATSEKVTRSVDILLTLCRMLGRNCSDGLATLYCFKAILKSHYDLNLYKKTHTRILTVKLKQGISLSYNKVVSPVYLQKHINYYTRKCRGRVVLRKNGSNPNGTELVIFTEASSEEQCDILCLKIADLFYENCGGIGEYPAISYSIIYGFEE
ncbi:AGM1 [Enterospora canceri]|uniref:AGM1 n=1 Tax=Enterospora canceri TaxID=1081671 RepID=A0A1Y1S5Y7_9MICR|nr:AGM1 [Enterospora canceri]